MGHMRGKIRQNYDPYFSILYRSISQKFDKGVFRFSDVEAYDIHKL